MLNWCNDIREIEIISRIADRMIELDGGQKSRLNKMRLVMDIEACHCNGNPLKLEELLNAKDFDFVHDVLGIQRHIDRTTGELMDCFFPRYSKSESEIDSDVKKEFLRILLKIKKMAEE